VSSAGPPALDQYRVDPVSFDQQLQLLWESGYRTVPIDQWRRASEGHGSLPKRPLLLTFDDGYLDFVTDAWPALQRYGYGALVSLVTECVGGANQWDAEFGPPIPLMDWPAVSELHRQGVEFGAHTATHSRLTSLDPVAATREIWTSKVQLEEQLGGEVAAFVYPHGARNPQIASLVRGCGFACALDGRFGVVGPGEDMFDLPRIEVQLDTSPATLLATISDAHDQLRASQASHEPGALGDRYPQLRRLASHLPDRPRRALTTHARRILGKRLS
jgi:peptidoglycan/xylan/chitin deacetylase (PgdA/CDA1 family)